MILVVLAGGSLASGGANALNHFLERHSDQKMTRTQKRPVASQRIMAWQAMAFGVGLNAAAFAVLAVWANLLSAALTLGATVFYVLVYTAYLKRRTPQNIVIGGAAGAVPPMVGWAAVTGGLDLEALYLFAIIFFWTPAHFWALALLIRNDYARAEIPMLPVVRGVKETTWNILLYSFLTVALTMVFFTTQAVDWLYLYISAPLGCDIYFPGSEAVAGRAGEPGEDGVFVFAAVPGRALHSDHAGQHDCDMSRGWGRWRESRPGALGCPSSAYSRL